MKDTRSKEDAGSTSSHGWHQCRKQKIILTRFELRGVIILHIIIFGSRNFTFSFT